MAPTDREPRPRDEPIDIPRWCASVSSIAHLPVGEPGPATTFAEILDRRRSTRALRPASRSRLATFLWHAARTRAARSGKEHRAAASAGGLHPIETVLIGDDDVPELYDAQRHALCALDVATAAELCAAAKECRSIVPSARGVLLVFGADTGRTDAAYLNAESLLWRDAGCMLATFHLVATWLGLGFCPLGVLGEAVWASIDPLGRIVPTGAAMLGEPAEPHSE